MRTPVKTSIFAQGLSVVMILSLLLTGLLVTPAGSADAAAQAAPELQAQDVTPVFINEIHYDDSSPSDTGEGIEIAGPAGTDLAGWSLVLYNGSGGADYDTNNLSGIIPDLQNGFGAIFFSYPTNGIQDGAPDGIALVDDTGSVVQFLSYEGSFSAVTGPAVGLASTDIGVSESSSTPPGYSLQLVGTGSVYEDFAWQVVPTSTYDAINAGQIFPAASESLLLLTELVVTPTAGEFVEIYNPGNSTVDLSDVYLTDATFAGGSTYYYQIVLGGGGGGGFSDFHARFPDGATIAAGEYQTVALAGSEAFSTTYGIEPTYELYEEDVASPDAVPDMREAFPGSINHQGGLTNDGEVAILYYWDGASDLVTDLDYVVYGDKVEAVDKTGVSIDGPDADTDPSTYLPDTAISLQDALGTGHAFGSSWQRDDLTEGAEVTSGGNGYNGQDETSEDVSNTWCEGPEPTPGAASYCPPDLVVTKTGPATTEAGEDIVYTITVELAQDAVAVNPVLTDTLPISTTYVSDNSGFPAVEVAPGVYEWSGADIAGPDFIYTFNLTVTTDIDAAPGTLLVNQVEISAELPGDDPSNNTDSWNTSILNVIPIHDIQYVPDPAVDDASPYDGQVVTVEGIVTAEPGELDTGTRLMAIQDEAGGPWSGVYVFRNGGLAGLTAPEGTEVRVTGIVDEYFGLTEIVVSDVSAVEVLSTGNPVPDPVNIPTGDYIDPSTAEQWEGVYIRFNDAVVTNDNLGFGEWAFDDGSGSTAADDLGENDGDLTYMPSLGDEYFYIRGIGYYSFGVYKLAPRYDADILLAASEIALSKSAPIMVAPGERFTYTLEVTNPFEIELTGVTVTDAVPANANFAEALDGGFESGGTVSWLLPSLASQQTAQVRFAVTATTETPATIVNGDYAVSASNWTTPTVGIPVYTVVGDELSIHDIQGPGDTSPFVGAFVESVDGVVTNILNNGFFMQEPDPDANPDTSEGIWVYTGSAPSVITDTFVQITGTVDEYFGLTELAASDIATSTIVMPIASTDIGLPMPADDLLEPYEGMLVTITETLTVDQNYFLGRYGQLTLSSEGRLYHPNNGNDLGEDSDLNWLRMLILDDNTSVQNPVPVPYLGPEDTVRAGDEVSVGLTGVVDWGTITSTGLSWYRMQPTQPVEITRVNERTAAPDPVGGNLKVASFNVLNYFNGDGQGGGFPTSRGADTLEEFERQRTKIITALLSIDADIVGLMEIENDGDGPESAVADLVNGLNAEAGAGTYAYVDDPVDPFGTDEIKVAMIYKTASVEPLAPSMTDLNDAGTEPDPIYSRPPLAQTFLSQDGGVLTVIVNHFKSKGSCPPPGDPNADQGDDQGCWNLLRIQQAEAMVVFVNELQAETGDQDVLVIGDLNSYGEEDPIDVLTNAGLVNEVAQDVPAAERYTYVFDGQAGYLDHALATPHLDDQVTGATIWHINADEPSILDYNTEFNPPELYEPDAYRSSDHDPVIVGLNLLPAQIGFSQADYTVGEAGGTATITVTLDGIAPYDVYVDYAAAAGTATDGQDFTAVSGTLVFTAGVMTQTFMVPVLDDSLDEADETVDLSLSSPVMGDLVTASAVLTILDDDPAVSVQVSAAAVAVDESAGSVAITVTLSAASGQEVTVDYATSDGTATAGSDYTSVSGTLTFAAGEIEKSVSIPILDDSLDEPDETFFFALSNPVNATLAEAAQTTITILDNDLPAEEEFMYYLPVVFKGYTLP